MVKFGQRRILTGIVGKIHRKKPENYEVRDIIDVLDDHPIVNTFQIGLFKWISEYYLSPIGEVLNIALPAGFKLGSESKIQMNPDYRIDQNQLSDKELMLLEILDSGQTLDYQKIGEVLSLRNFNPVIKSLLSRNAIRIYEEVQEKYKPKLEKRVKLAEDFNNQKALETLFDKLEKYPRQVDVLLKYLQEVPLLKNPQLNQHGIQKKLFKDTGLSVSAVNTLIKNKVLEEWNEVVSRIHFKEEGPTGEIELNKDQRAARNKILSQFQENNTVLLHGITGSGKTEIYIDLIRDVLNNGGQVLYLLPEIALTTQIVSRLTRIFGNEVGIYHSKFSDNERVEVWKNVLSGKTNLVVGVRSSIFLPFDNLELIVVDEEHENSYKQFDPAPRYHARDTALVLARLHHAKVLLGSATPSIESFFLARNKKYGYVSLNRRFGVAVLPEIQLINIREEAKKKQMHGDFSTIVIEALQKDLQVKDQAIIFQNRRGYSPHVRCEECAWIPKCSNCSVSLTYHLKSHELKCHYCGHREKLPGFCQACGSANLKTIGFGTEKIEDDLKLLLSEAKVQRMDWDTTRNKYGYERILEEFENGNIDILVGTQMVSKGLDFGRVNLVAILDVDRMLNFPDFRSYERTFQLVTQVSGRAGRREKSGRVIIQTAHPDHPLLEWIINNDYEGFFGAELAERKVFNYPPFVRVIRITIRHKDQQKVMEAATELGETLKLQLGKRRVLGPEEPLIGRIRNQYLRQILLKIERERVNLHAVKEIVHNSVSKLAGKKEYRKVDFVFDVDPY